MKLLTSRLNDRHLHVVVHLDETRTVDGEPDPAYVAEYVWGLPVRPSGETAAAYRTRLRNEWPRLRAETKLLARIELDRLSPATQPGEALPGEGQAL